MSTLLGLTASNDNGRKKDYMEIYDVTDKTKNKSETTHCLCKFNGIIHIEYTV